MRATWAELECQLFGAAMSDPTGYQRAIRAVRLLVDVLAIAQSTGQLAGLWEQAVELLVDGASAHGLSLAGLSERQIAGAAFRLRDLELRARELREERVRQIAVARAAGATWVVLEEAGEPAVGWLNPYRCLEMHLPTGLAAASAVELATAGPPSLRVTVVRLDPSSGAVLGDCPEVNVQVVPVSSGGLEVLRAAARNRVEAVADLLPRS
ncbi:MAG: hypothetical protein KIT35_03465 [Piscinibacter sp.]|uniref:hypothetical protein n=1 Tax=Piscinibacter sp. TaxID=1903157 RepID=UPI00258420FF|nr:hypothetical protein [Piscinibacter sp.]MCW5662871.1 hypothetical protein [Piscinibacter sp.]